MNLQRKANWTKNSLFYTDEADWKACACCSSCNNINIYCTSYKHASRHISTNYTWRLKPPNCFLNELNQSNFQFFFSSVFKRQLKQLCSKWHRTMAILIKIHFYWNFMAVFYLLLEQIYITNKTFYSVVICITQTIHGYSRSRKPIQFFTLLEIHVLQSKNQKEQQETWSGPSDT